MVSTFPSNHEDDGPTDFELQVLVLEVAREEHKPLLENYAAEYAASVRAYRHQASSGTVPATPFPVYDASHLDAAYFAILARARIKVLNVLKLNMRPTR